MRLEPVYHVRFALLILLHPPPLGLRIAHVQYGEHLAATLRVEREFFDLLVEPNARSVDHSRGINCVAAKMSASFSIPWPARRVTTASP